MHTWILEAHQSCGKAPQGEVKNKSYKYIENINAHYNTLLQKTRFCWKRHYSAHKYSPICSSAFQQTKDEVELKKRERVARRLLWWAEWMRGSAVIRVGLNSGLRHMSYE